jgi:nitroimidazol reductase NimA-like FMN-containing flavoprotein (pyridoxamine 5'-phosphate oxidase superfamily)
MSHLKGPSHALWNLRPEESSMLDEHDLAARARKIIHASLYVVLGTADEAGRPWVSPVYYAARGAAEFFWTSSVEATHSRNIVRRPEISMVVFDSRVPAYTGEAVYMSAMAEELADTDLERALEVFPGPAKRGGRKLAAEQLGPAAPHRMYRAVVSEHWMLCPRSPGATLLCPAHQRAYDHRTPVAL